MLNLEALKEFTDEMLEKELQRRSSLRSAGLCSYCGKRLDTKSFQSEHPCPHHEIYEKELPGRVLGRQIIVRRKF